jgi:hypothetical protein
MQQAALIPLVRHRLVCSGDSEALRFGNSGMRFFPRGEGMSVLESRALVVKLFGGNPLLQVSGHAPREDWKRQESTRVGKRLGKSRSPMLGGGREIALFGPIADPLGDDRAGTRFPACLRKTILRLT